MAKRKSFDERGGVDKNIVAAAQRRVNTREDTVLKNENVKKGRFVTGSPSRIVQFKDNADKKEFDHKTMLNYMREEDRGNGRKVQYRNR